MLVVDLLSYSYRYVILIPIRWSLQPSHSHCHPHHPAFEQQGFSSGLHLDSSPLGSGYIFPHLPSNRQLRPPVKKNILISLYVFDTHGIAYFFERHKYTPYWNNCLETAYPNWLNNKRDSSSREKCSWYINIKNF